MDFIADNKTNITKPSQLRILVVDDDVLNQRMMQLLLGRDGHLVDLASNGLEAFEAVKTQNYDVVFMDLQMPVMDGVEASRCIRTWENGGPQHTFIVALTASYLPEEGPLLFEAGIDNYISKPFELEQIKRLLKYAFMGNQDSAREELEIPGQLLPEVILDVQKGIVKVGGDEGIYKELLTDFMDELPKRLQALQRFYAARDLVELSRAAHNLNGIAANLGALQLSVYARKLDKQSVAGYTESLDPLIRDIQAVVSQLLEVSNNFLAEKQVRIGSV